MYVYVVCASYEKYFLGSIPLKIIKRCLKRGNYVCFFIMLFICINMSFFNLGFQCFNF